MTVRRWKDVTISGGDMFVESNQPTEFTKAMDLRKLSQPAECSAFGVRCSG